MQQSPRVFPVAVKFTERFGSPERPPRFLQQALPTPTAAAGRRHGLPQNIAGFLFHLWCAFPLRSLLMPPSCLGCLEDPSASWHCSNSSISLTPESPEANSALVQDSACLREGQSRNWDPWCLVIKENILVKGWAYQVADLDSWSPTIHAQGGSVQRNLLSRTAAFQEKAPFQFGFREDLTLCCCELLPPGPTTPSAMEAVLLAWTALLGQSTQRFRENVCWGTSEERKKWSTQKVSVRGMCQ